MASYKQTKNGYQAQVAVLGVRKSASFRTRREAVAWASYTEEKIRADAKNKREFHERVGTKSSVVSSEEIMRCRINNHSIPGIYILFDGDLVTYIGQSRNVHKRITGHSGNGRKFTSYYVIPCMEQDLDRLEQYYIDLLTPPDNKTPLMKRVFIAQAPESGFAN